MKLNYAQMADLIEQIRSNDVGAMLVAYKAEKKIKSLPWSSYGQYTEEILYAIEKHYKEKANETKIDENGQLLFSFMHSDEFDS